MIECTARCRGYGILFLVCCSGWLVSGDWSIGWGKRCILGWDSGHLIRRTRKRILIKFQRQSGLPSWSRQYGFDKTFSTGINKYDGNFYDWSQNDGDNYQSTRTYPILNPPLDATILNSAFWPPGSDLLMISIACISCVDLFNSCLIHCCNSPHGEWSSIKILLSVFSKVLVRWSWKRQRGQDNGVESVGVIKYHEQMQALKPFSLTI